MGVFRGGRGRGPPIEEIFAPFKYSLSSFAKPHVQFLNNSVIIMTFMHD